MSGIFGIFNRNSKPVNQKIVNTMFDAMSYSNSDERDTWVGESVALGHIMLWNTPESKYEHLPLQNQAYVLTMDARIDNRDELVAKLELPNHPLGQIGDSEFILAAYKKWGAECPKYLLGDFVFVIWDEAKKQLFCARDHVGIKPFYYYIDENIFVFTNNIRAMEQHPFIPKNIDTQMVLSYLHEVSQPSITFYENVKKLMPATSMIIQGDKVIMETYWKADNVIPIILNSLDEYAEKLLLLLEDAVKVRLRTAFPVAAHLSGGLDSSSISVLAARLLKKEKKKLHTFSWLHPPGENDNIDHFEWSNGQRISKLEDILYSYIDVNVETFEKIYESHNILYMDKIDFWNEFEVRKGAKKEGVRTILSGWGGDELISFNGGYSYNAELFWQGKILLSLKNYFKLSRKSKYPSVRLIITLTRQLILPIFSNVYFDRVYNFLSTSMFSSLDPLECMKTNFKRYEKKHKITAHHQMRKLSKRSEQINRIYLGSLTDRIESWASSGSLDNIEYRYPLLDKRLVEFALSIPIELYRENDTKRYIFRYSIRNLLPSDIVWSDTKYENERADKHFRLMYDFLQHWLDELEDKKASYEKNKFVDIDKLEKYIQSIVSKPLDLNDTEVINKMTYAGQYILLLKL